MTENPLIVRALRAANYFDLADKIESCGKETVVFWDTDSDGPVHRPKFCKSRWCPHCSRMLAVHQRARLRFYFDLYPIDSLRFVTLTQRARVGESLKKTSARFEKAWQSLRRSEFWLSHVTGAIKKIEINRNVQKGHWHYHAHLIVHGDYIPEKQLRAEWLRITGDSMCIDVRHIDRTTIREMSKYVTKFQAWSPDSLGELVHWAKSKRFLESYGDLRLPMIYKDRLDEGHNYIYLGTANQFWRAVVEHRYRPYYVDYANWCLTHNNPFYSISEYWRAFLIDYIDCASPI